MACRVHRRNLLILVCCQLISATGSIVMVTLGGIIGSTLASNKAWATLPLSMVVLASALTTVPATLIMRRIGRRRGFAMSSLSAVMAVSVAALALRLQSFYVFLLAGLMFGINMAFTQQDRYAAAESVPAAQVSKAISFVLLGAIGGAFLGRELATRGLDWLSDVTYAGTMLSLAALYCVPYMLLMELAGFPVEEPGGGEAEPVSRLAARIGAVTDEEEEELVQYLAFIRARRRRGS